MAHHNGGLVGLSLAIFLAMGQVTSLAQAEDKSKGGTPQIIMNMQMMDTTTKKVVANMKQSGDMANLMKAQKDMTYQMLTNVGINPQKLPPEVQKELATPHTDNFHAFIAYAVSVGFAAEGRYAESQLAARQAVSLDPKFKEAVRHSYATPASNASLQQIQQASHTQSLTRAGSMMSGSVPLLPNRGGPPAGSGGPTQGGGKPEDKKPISKPQDKPTDQKGNMVKNAVDKVLKTNQLMGKLAESVKNNPANAAALMEKTIVQDKLSPDLALVSALDKISKPDEKTIKNMITIASQHGMTNDKMAFIANTMQSNEGGCK